MISKLIHRAFFALIFLLFSCTENKDLQMREVLSPVTTGRVVISPQWGVGIQPQPLCYCLYPMGVPASKAICLEGTAAGCGSDLPAGDYRVLAYNADATGVRFAEMDDYAMAVVELIPVATRSGGYVVVGEPPEVYVAAMPEELVIVAGGQTESNAAVRKLMRTLVFNFSSESNLSLDKLESTLCGVYPSVLLSTGEPTQRALQAAPEVAVCFGADFRSVTKATGTVRVPGLLDPQNGTVYDNVLNLKLDTPEGGHYTSAVNLNGALTQILADNGGVLPVEVPIEMSIRLERTAVGLSAAVEGWKVGETSEGTIH